MAVYQATVLIQATTFVGTGSLIYEVNQSANLTWDIGGGVEYAVSAQSGPPTIVAGYLFSASVQIFGQGFTDLTSTRTQISAIAQDYAPDDFLTISVDEDGEWLATLDDTFWSDLGQTSVYPGFRIVCGDGLAIITEDPQYHVKTVGIDVITAFQSWRMHPEQWNLYIPLGTDFNRSVTTPNYFRTSELLTAYFNDIREFLVSESQYLTHRAGDLRKWNKIPEDFLDQLLATLGCYLRLDRLDSEGRRRLSFEWIRFLQYAGTEYFVDFLGYIYDTYFGVKACWTNDYRNFPFPEDIDRSSGQRVSDTPGYYPTNHVALTYDLDLWGDLGVPDLNYETWSLVVGTFYKLASVPLVLQTLASYRTESFDLHLIICDQTTRNYFSWSPPLIISNMTLYLAVVDHRRIRRESHSPPMQLNYTTVYMVMFSYKYRKWSDYSPMLNLG